MKGIVSEKSRGAFLHLNENRFLVSWGSSFLHSSWQGPSCGPLTPMAEMILGVWQRYPGEAQRILRKRIYVNYEPTLICRETCKVGAKRFSIVPEFVLPADSNIELVHFALDRFSHLIEFQNTLEDLLEEQTDLSRLNEESMRSILSQEAFEMKNRLGKSEGSSRLELPELDSKNGIGRVSQKRRVLTNRLISCSMLKKSGEVLGRAHNGAESGMVFHAETLLLLGYWSRTHMKIPREVVLLTSLKCCRMCAAFFWFLSESPLDSRVFFIERDPGRWGRETVLNAGSSIRRNLPMVNELSSIERESFLQVEIETQLSLN